MRIAVRRLPGGARACALATALVFMAAVPAAGQERTPETLVPETHAPETLVPQSEAWDRGTPWNRGTPMNAERAFVELERLQAEIAVLRGLSRAQAALLAWNRERAEGGAGPAVLAAGLCAEPALAVWCRALPATFGADAGTAPEREQARDVGR